MKAGNKQNGVTVPNDMIDENLINSLMAWRRVFELNVVMQKVTYGILTRRVTAVYSSDERVSKAEGAWISQFLINGCGMVLGDYDDVIIAKHDSLPLHELQSIVCQGPDEEQDDDDTPRGLGVWWGGALDRTMGGGETRLALLSPTQPEKVFFFLG